MRGRAAGEHEPASEKLLVGKQAANQSREGAAGACNHDATWVLEGHSSKDGIVVVLSLLWLQLDVGFAAAPRHAMRKASMEKDFFRLIMK